VIELTCRWSPSGAAHGPPLPRANEGPCMAPWVPKNEGVGRGGSPELHSAAKPVEEMRDKTMVRVEACASGMRVACACVCACACACASVCVCVCVCVLRVPSMMHAISSATRPNEVQPTARCNGSERLITVPSGTPRPDPLIHSQPSQGQD